MKLKYSKSLLSFLVILIASLSLQSCSLFLRHAVNKKYPPVDVTDKKIESVCRSKQMLENTTGYDLELDISQELLNEVSKTYLEQSNTVAIGQVPELKSVKILSLQFKMDKQEFGIESREILELNNQYIKKVEVEIFAATSPYFEAQRFYVNPYFNRIKIKKIEFVKCPLLTKFGILKMALNAIASNYLSNINGQVKNYNFEIKPTPGGTKKMSELIGSSTPLNIENDADIVWKSYVINGAILIDDSNLRVVATLDDVKRDIDLPCEKCTKCCKKERRKFFEKKYAELERHWNATSIQNFDDIDISKNYLTIKAKTTFIESAFNETFSNLDFRYTYPVPRFESVVPASVIKVGKPDLSCNCSKCDDVAWWKRGACYFGCITYWIPTCLLAKGALEAIYAPFGGRELPIGKFGGKVRGDGNIHGSFAGLASTGRFGNISIYHGHRFNGNVSHAFEFNGFAGVGFVACPYLFVDGDYHVTANIDNPLTSKIEKINNLSVCTVKISPDPTTIKINLNESPALNIFADLRNNFTCNLTLLAIGGFSWALASLILRDQQSLDMIMAAITGKLDYKYQIDTIEYPMKYSYDLEGRVFELSSYWGDTSLNAYLLKP